MRQSAERSLRCEGHCQHRYNIMITGLTGRAMLALSVKSKPSMVLPSLLPMLPVFAIQIPVKDMLLNLITTLV